MLEDIDIGKDIANNIGGKKLTLREFIDRVDYRLDWDRFDYENGETALIEAILITQYAFIRAGGEIDYSVVEQAKEQERKALEEDAKAMVAAESQDIHERGPAIGQEALRQMYERYHIE